MREPTPPASIAPPDNVRPTLALVALLGALVVLFMLPDPFGVWSPLILAIVIPLQLALVVIIAWCSFVEPALLLRRLREDRAQLEAQLTRELARAPAEHKARRRRDLLAAERAELLEGAREMPAAPPMGVIIRAALRKVALSLLVFLVPVLFSLLLGGREGNEGFVMVTSLLALIAALVVSVLIAGQVMQQRARKYDHYRIILHVAAIDELAGGISLSEPGAGEGELEVAAQHGQLEQIGRERR